MDITTNPSFLDYDITQEPLDDKSQASQIIPLVTYFSGRDGFSSQLQTLSAPLTTLIGGRLGLFLGAGISLFYGLPSWEILVSRVCESVREDPLASGEDPIKKIAYLRSRYFDRKVPEFRKAVKEALYRGKTLDFEEIRKSPTLAAIGSLVMSSKRGSAARVFTLNYDDLLENYLEYHGFLTSTVYSDRHWATNDDVTIYHPHGFLPISGKADSEDIVFGTSEYLDIMSSELWRPLLQTALRTHTFLYVGTSGDDIHVQSLIASVKGKYPDEGGYYYQGVRFALEGAKDEVGYVLEGDGVFTHRLSSYDDIPAFLFKICQQARVLRIEEKSAI